jgi:hypothetical protein
MADIGMLGEFGQDQIEHPHLLKTRPRGQAGRGASGKRSKAGKQPDLGANP